MGSVKKAKFPEFVVAIDFGTTFSKAAYAVSPHHQPARDFDIEKVVNLIKDWPYQDAATGSRCSKTKTCMWYVRGGDVESFELVAWGWEAYVRFKKNIDRTGRGPGGTSGSRRNLERQQDPVSKKRGFLICDFKLWHVDPGLVDLPKGLCLRRVTSDFLREMSSHIVKELQMKYGEKVSKKEIQWCITVPSIWTEKQRQIMEECSEIAGIVRGTLCEDENASLYDLITVVEPEAASIYCYNLLNHGEINMARALSKGETFLVVDIGGGTTDLVTHKKIGTTTRANIRVKEVTKSIGGLYGGVHVDDGFLRHMSNVIGPSYFRDFEIRYPYKVLELLMIWGRIKASFSGDIDQWEVELSCKLVKASGYRNEIVLTSSEIAEIFDRVVNSILELVRKAIIPGLDFLYIVGGFSESSYVRRRINAMMEHLLRYEVKRPAIIFPQNADTAVVQGAVAVGVHGEWESFVHSRIAKRTYGFDTSVPFNPELHPIAYMVRQLDATEMLCDNVFQICIRRGDEIAFNSKVEFETSPLYREGHGDDDNIEINLYSSNEKDPKYVLGEGVMKEGTCTILVPGYRTYRMARKPRLKISVFFGGTRIRFAVWGANFSGEQIAMPPIKFVCAAENDRDYEEEEEIGLIERRREVRLKNRDC